jgi:signal transduction histidine kinase
LSKTVRYRLLALIGMIVLFTTLTVFFVGFSSSQKSLIDYVALMFVLISEVSFFIGTALANKTNPNKLFLTAGIFSTLGIYWLISTLVSIFYQPLFGQNLNGLITTQVIVMALAAIAVLGISLASSTLSGKSSKESILQACENTVFTLKNDTRTVNYSHQLNELFEALKYSDKTVAVTDTENEIKGKVDELCDLFTDEKQQDSTNATTDKINEVMLLIKQRSQLAAQMKKGAF